MNKILIILSVLLNTLGQCQTKSDEIPWGTVKENFIGGQSEFYNVFNTKVKYPESLKKDGVVGTVYFEIEIDTTGNISNFKILRGVAPLMDKEVEEKIYLTNDKWKPLMIEGKKSKYKLTEKVYFELR